MNKQILIIFLLISFILTQIPLKKTVRETYVCELENASIPLVYLSDYNYYTEFEMGTPAQKVYWLQDTWVGETWLNLNISNQTFIPSQSSTFNKSNISASYNYTLDVGIVNGYLGTEVIGIQAINLTNLKIPILFGENGTGRGATYTGSVGLANNYNYKNWLEIAKQENILSDSLFAYDMRYGDYFYAGSATFPKGTTTTELTWYGTKRQNYWSMGTFTYTAINSVSYPQDTNSLEAVWDSGCLVTYITKKAFTGLVTHPQIANYCQLNPAYQLYFCPCNQTYPNITAHTDEMDFKAISKDYMFEMSGGYCVLGIIDNPSNWAPFMIFGTAMFKNYFVAYDKENAKIGFSSGKYLEKDNARIVKKLLTK